MPNPTRVINITGFSNGIPTMTNGGNVDCNPGDFIRWNCPPASGTITGITYASGSVVFSSGPSPVGGGNWQGQISEALFSSPNPPSSVDENYNITGNPPGGQPHSHDPKIIVTPPPPAN